MSSYGLIVMSLGVCVSGSTAAVCTGGAGWSLRVQIPLEAIFLFNNLFLCTLYGEGDKHQTMIYQLIDGL